MHTRAVALFCLLSLCSGLAAAERTELLAYASNLQGTKAGVDEAGQLWFWDASTRTVTMIGDDGIITSDRLPNAISVDVDGRRGIVALVEGGNALQVLSLAGSPHATIRLTDPAGDIAWMTGSLVAVTPRFADHRIALWDTSTGTRVQTIGKALPIHWHTGQHLARSTLVRFNVLRNELVALDATFGNLYAFDASGEATRSERLPRLSASVDYWLSTEDVVNESIVLALWRYRSFSVDPEGAAWIPNPADDGPSLFVYAAGQPVRSVYVNDPPCAGALSIPWRTKLLFVRDIASRSTTCAAEVDRTTAATSPFITAVQIGEAVSPARRLRRVLPLIEPNCSYPITADGKNPEYYCTSALSIPRN